MRKIIMLSDYELNKTHKISMSSQEKISRICSLLGTRPEDIAGHFTDAQIDVLLDNIVKEKEYLEFYADDELWPLDSDDIDYSIYSWRYEHLRDYVDGELYVKDKEMAAVVKEILDCFDFLHTDLTEEDWECLKQKYKATPVNEAKELIARNTMSYRKAFKEAHDKYICDYARAYLKQEAPDLIGAVIS